jgi:probable F420-dependent oxidoreductase
MSARLEGTGVWSAALRYGDRAAAATAVAEVEALGYTAAWVPDVGGDLFRSIEQLLEATRSITVATGILNLWMHEAAETAERHAEFVERFGPRVLFGIGVSHAPLIDSTEAGRYRRPLARTAAYLDELDAAATPLAPQDRVLAALGPKMLELARTRSAGSHPYLVAPEHTHRVRDALGPDLLVAPEQAVVLTSDRRRAHELAREHLAGYLGLPNYSNNWRRIGFDDEDLAGGGSDRLVDALVVWGDEDRILARVQEHRDAGADHVCVQVLTDDLMLAPVEQWRALAPALNDG